MSGTNFSFGWEDLEQWVVKGLISSEQLTHIRAYIESGGPLSEQSPASPRQRKRLNLISLAYYFGGFMILFAYTIFMGIQWEKLSQVQQITVSGLTILILWAIGYFLQRKGFQTPGGLLIFAGTGIVPLLVFSLQRATGIWPDDSQYTYRDFYRIVAQTWIILEVVSMLIAVLVIWIVRFPLITLLIAFWGWFLSMDITRWIAHSDTWTWSEREQIVSIAVGIGMLALGILLQRMAKQDYSIWFYLFGQIIIFTNLSYWTWSSELNQIVSIVIGLGLLAMGILLQRRAKLDHSPLFYLFGHLIVFINLSALTLSKEGLLGILYFLVYLAFVIASVWLQRRIFLVFGAIGVYSYLSYLAFQVFDGALGFPFALASIGLLVILTAVGYQKYIRPWLERRLSPTRS